MGLQIGLVTTEKDTTFFLASSNDEATASESGRSGIGGIYWYKPQCEKIVVIITKS